MMLFRCIYAEAHLFVAYGQKVSIVEAKGKKEWHS